MITPDNFKNSPEFKQWKKGIVRRKLEKLDELLSSGEWISNSRMIEEVNALYLEAPNDECYISDVPHRILQSKETNLKRPYESVLYLTYAGTIRQDRKTIHDILRLVGKEHLQETTNEGDGTEGSYRYRTNYSIFDRYTINDIEFDDYELYKSVPVVLEAVQSGLKTGEKDTYLEEVANDIMNLDFATTQSISLLSTLDKALKQAWAINNNIVSSLLDNVFGIYDGQKGGGDCLKSRCPRLL